MCELIYSHLFYQCLNEEQSRYKIVLLILKFILSVNIMTKNL
jgi:hypothetical protein